MKQEKSAKKQKKPRPSDNTPCNTGERTLSLLQKIQAGIVDPRCIRPAERRLIVSYLIADGYSTADMAQILKVSDRSIERDKKAIREENALSADPQLVEQMTGRLVCEAELSIQRIRKTARDKNTPQAVKVDAEHRCYQIISDMIGEKALRVFRYPKEDRDVADIPQLSLVVLDLNMVVDVDEIPDTTRKFIEQIVKKHGQSFRKHANSLIFLAPDKQRAIDVLDAARRLLALRNIDDDQTTKKRFTEEQKKDLASRLKEAESRLPGAISSAYRYVIVPTANKILRSFDMGISILSAAELLSNKAIEILKNNDQLLERLDPSILIGPKWKLWPEDKDTIHVPTLAGYFSTLTHLPAITSLDVLQESIAKGVERGLFAYALGNGDAKKFDTIYFRKVGKDLTDFEITDSAWLLRPALAKSLLPETELTPSEAAAKGQEIEKVVSSEDQEITSDSGELTGGVKIVEGERRLSRVRIVARIPWENWHDIYNEVIDPLAREGADILCDVVILAKAEDAIRENTVELVIKESLSQRGIDAKIET